MRIRPHYFFILAIFFSLAVFSMSVFAANIYNIQYSVQPQTVGIAANHTIYFQSRAALSSGTLVLNLQNLISSTGSVIFSDIDLSYGSTADSAQTQLTLGASAGSAIWGVGVDGTNRKITFSYPSSGNASIPADQVITIKIGTHATSQTTGVNQLTNATTVTSGGKMISLVTGGEVGVVSVLLVTSGTLSSGATAPTPAASQTAAAVVAPAAPTPTSAPAPEAAPEKAAPQSSPSAQTPPPPQESKTEAVTKSEPSSTTEGKTEVKEVTKPPEEKKAEEKPVEKSDTTPPVSSLTPQGTVGENNWYKSSVTISLSAKDDGGLIPTILYRIGVTGEFLLYKNPLTFSSDGEKTLYYYAVDVAGNKETQKSIPIRIDTIPPTGSAILNGGNTLSNRLEDIPLTLQCQDTHSTCAVVKLSQNGTSWTPWQKIVPTTTLDYTSDGKKTLFVLFKDTAGHESQVISLPEILIDTTPPVVSPDIQSPEITKGKETSRKLRSNELYAGTAAALSAKLPLDAVSSIASFQWEVIKKPTSGDFTITNPTSQETEVSATVAGTYTLRVTVIDTAGNKTTSEITLRIVDPNERLTVPELKKTDKTITHVEESKKMTLSEDVESTLRSSTAEIKLAAGSIDTSHFTESSSNRPSSANESVSGQISGENTGSGSSGTSFTGSSSSGGGMSLQPAEEQGTISIELSKLPCKIASETVGTDILAVSPSGTKLMGCAVDRVIANYEFQKIRPPVSPARGVNEQSLLQSVPRQPSDSLGSRILQFLGRIDGTPAFAQEKSLPLYPVYQRVIPITEFEKKPTLTFLYTQKEASSIYVDTIHLYAWNSETNQWISEEETAHNREKNTVTAEVDHLSLFGLFAEPIPLPRHLKEEVVYTAAPGQFEQPKILLTNGDLGLTQTDTNRPISFAENEFFTSAHTGFDLCVPARIFQQKSVKKITLSSAGERTALLYDKSKACYSAHFQAPQKKGTYDVILKIIYGDDVVQTFPLAMTITSGVQAHVLAAVAPPIKEIQKAATIVNTETKKAVETSEPALQASIAVSVPMIAVANPAIAVNTIQWFYYINYLFSWILSLVGLRKRRKPWGVVYDAITKNPVDLAIVRLIESKTKKLIETQVTDKNGRFSFVPTPGEYILTATKQEFVFPSKIITESLDGEYTNIYRQESIVIKNAEEAIQISIPLDQKAPAILKKKTLHTMAQELVGKYALASLVISMTISIALTTYVPSTLNAILLLVNSIFIMSQVMLMAHEQKPWGIVFNALSLKPVPLAAIAIFDAKQQKLLRSRLTDYYGRFNFLAPAGEFILSVSKDQYTFPAHTDIHVKKYKHLYFGGTIQVKKGHEIVRTNIPLEEKQLVEATKPVAQEAPQQTPPPSS